MSRADMAASFGATAFEGVGGSARVTASAWPSARGNALYREVQADVADFIENGSAGDAGLSRSVGSASVGAMNTGSRAGAMQAGMPAVQVSAWSGGSGFASMAPSSWPMTVPRGASATGGEASALSSGSGSGSAGDGSGPGPASASGVGSGGTGVSPQAQREFLDEIAPYARKAAERLGVAPDLVAAQAALESGWGRKPLRRADGSDAHNLFGIKAAGGWPGEVANAMTSERSGPATVRSVKPFRSYGDVSAGFDDYASLLAERPRYRAALGAGGDARAFANGLAQGGYATDPGYADKLVRLAAQINATRGSSGIPSGAMPSATMSSGAGSGAATSGGAMSSGAASGGAEPGAAVSSDDAPTDRSPPRAGRPGSWR